MIKLLILSIVTGLILSSCGGDSSTYSSNRRDTQINALDPIITSIKPLSERMMSTTPGVATLPGKRASYSIVKDANSYIVNDSTGVPARYTNITAIKFDDFSVNLKIGDNAQTIRPYERQNIIELYIAYFNRIPDADGLSYWIDQLRSGLSIDQIGESFYQSALQYSQLTGYRQSMTNDDFIKVIYKNVLGRNEVDLAGMQYWAKALSIGTATRGTLVNSILKSAHTYKNNPTYGYVADLLDNKVLFSNLFAIQQGLNYSTSEASITNTMSLAASIQPSGVTAAINKLGIVDWSFRQVANLETSPIPVKSSSYANAKEMNIAPQAYPNVWNGVGPYEGFTAGTAFADFFQDGQQTMVGFSNVFAGTNGYGSTVAGKVYFFQKDGANNWVDKTSQLIADRTGCLSPRKVIVADFNGDGKPDVFVACHGIDGDIRVGYEQGEHPRMLLSQANGTYKNIDMGFNCYCHGAAAADFNGNGYADIVVASPPVLGRLKYLKNQKDGSFTDQPTLVPESTVRKSIWSLEFIDINNDGKLDLALYGSENTIANTIPGTQPWDWQPTIFVNDGTNKFTDGLAQVKLGYTYLGDVLDIIVKDSKIAILRAGKNSLIVQTFSYPTLAVTSMVNERLDDTVWFTLYNNNIVGAFASNEYTVPFK